MSFYYYCTEPLSAFVLIRFHNNVLVSLSHLVVLKVWSGEVAPSCNHSRINKYALKRRVDTKEHGLSTKAEADIKACFSRLSIISSILSRLKIFINFHSGILRGAKLPCHSAVSSVPLVTVLFCSLFSRHSSCSFLILILFFLPFSSLYLYSLSPHMEDL